MEHLAGETLADLIRRSARLSLIRKLELMDDLCAGLAYAHKSKIVHRDIKPPNLILDEEGSLKILDFGIARLGDSTMTQSGKIIGSVNYMSPEQISARAVDTRSDIFSVAVVMYELLSGRQAFPGSLHEVVLKIIQSDPIPLSEQVPGLDSELERIVTRGLKKDVGERYQSLRAMGRDLNRTRQRLEASSPDSDTISSAEGVPTVILTGPPPGGASDRQPDLPAERRRAEEPRERRGRHRLRVLITEGHWPPSRTGVPGPPCGAGERAGAGRAQPGGSPVA